MNARAAALLRGRQRAGERRADRSFTVARARTPAGAGRARRGGALSPEGLQVAAVLVKRDASDEERAGALRRAAGFGTR